MKLRIVLHSFLLALVGAPMPARADIVVDWNNAAITLIREGRTPPPSSSRALAILHTAMYDAINGISRTHEAYFVDSAVPASASKGAAGSAAAHRVVTSLFPAAASDADALHAIILAAIPDGPQKQSGMDWGHYVADQILAWRANDGFDAVVAQPGGSGPGVWVPTPPALVPYLLPQWAFVTPFTMTSCAQFRPAPPPALSSSDWASQYNLTKEIGSFSSASRTPDQMEIALFWADGAGTETPPGHWNHIAKDLLASHNLTLDETARLFALLNAALADAAICAWDAKYTYNWWRPVTAIRAGDTDGNNATEADPTWTPLIVTPPFPEHTSGHSTFSGAGATVLATYFGTDNIAFSTTSDFLPEVVRSFTSFSSAAEEAGMSRIYGGIHFMSANVEGLNAGANIGRWVSAQYFLPKGNRSRK